MRKLTSLEHLELDVLGQLTIMPRGLGALTRLESLSAFLVHNDEGRRIIELKNMDNLKGSFCISKLENVANPSEAGEASLRKKKFIKELEFRWSDTQGKWDMSSSHHNEILHFLRLNSNLEQLCIACYGGRNILNWIGNPLFHMLPSITLFKWYNAELLPCLGHLPSLNFLSFMEMNVVKEIGTKFGGSKDESFYKLETLELIGFSQLERWKVGHESDYKRLCKLVIEQCPKLTSVPSSLLQLHTLRHLEILHCKSLTSLLDKQLSTSL
ncbi:hypothetical protein SOVF_049320, partial [Spinacia oleracea]